VLPVGALLSLTAVVFSFRRRQVVGAWYWHHALHTALAQFVALAFFVSFGFIGLQTWAYKFLAILCFGRGHWGH
jgi:hypothetical protein